MAKRIGKFKIGRHEAAMFDKDQATISATGTNLVLSGNLTAQGSVTFDNSTTFANTTGNANLGGTLKVVGNCGFYNTAPVAQAAHIVAAETGHSITDGAGDLSAANETEIEGFLNALGTKINSIIVVLENLGLKASS